ncbi:MAG: NAD-dependent isocitrate dehydrogenase, partial [Anaerolineae bacterium]|nr:NAD-dependent isocitrate dehydrogenase [Anaerolineae bacterium]
MNAYRIAWLPGDGIGPEVTSAARFVLEALPLRLEWRPGAIGLGAFERLGTPLPDETLQ